MYRLILVGYDGRAGGRDALALAQRPRRDRGRRARPLRRARARSARHPRPRLRAGDGRGRGAALGARRASSSARPRSGSASFGGVAAPRALHEVAEDEDADVIVLGSTHRGGLGRVLPGSVGERLLHGAPCAVLVAPQRLRRARAASRSAAIGVGYDGNDRGEPRARGRRRARRPSSARRWRRSRSTEDGGAEPADPATRRRSWSSARASSTCWSSARAATARSATRCSAA